MQPNRTFQSTPATDDAKRAEMAEELRVSAAADLEAAARYRTLAESNPSLKRDYLRRADLCDCIRRAKLGVLDELKTIEKFRGKAR